MSEHNTEQRVILDVRAEAEGLPPGGRLPSVRQLMARHRASPITVQRAISRLAAEGVVEPRPGVGTFVPQSSAAAAREPDLSWQQVALGAGRRVDAGGLDALLALPRPGAIPLSSGYLDSGLQPTAALQAAMSRASPRPGSPPTPTAACALMRC
jgi:DNA-binding transcriptional MocR family regulator